MKRSICITLLAVGVAACSPPEWREGGASAPSANDWSMTPLVSTVTRSAQGIRISGLTEPQGRVVLRASDGAAYATGSDADGRFSVTAPSTSSDLLFVVEGQRGETTAYAPYELLILAGGPTAMLANGAPTRRVDAAGPLDAIDSDGRALIASGRAAPNADVRVRVDGRAAIIARAGADGRWSVPLQAEGAVPLGLTVGDRHYAYPGPGAASAPLAAPAGEGWRTVRRFSDTTWQSSWFPQAQP